MDSRTLNFSVRQFVSRSQTLLIVRVNGSSGRTHIVVLAQLEEPPDPSGTLGPQTLWVDRIRQAWQLPFSLLHHAQSQHAQVHRNNAAPHALSLPLPSASWSVARVPLAE